MKRRIKMKPLKPFKAWVLFSVNPKTGIPEIRLNRFFTREEARVAILYEDPVTGRPPIRREGEGALMVEIRQVVKD